VLALPDRGDLVGGEVVVDVGDVDEEHLEAQNASEVNERWASSTNELTCSACSRTVALASSRTCGEKSHMRR
jgi:hypothetical protein